MRAGLMVVTPECERQDVTHEDAENDSTIKIYFCQLSVGTCLYSRYSECMKSLVAKLNATKAKLTDEQLKIVEKVFAEQQDEMQHNFSLKTFFTPLIATFGLVTTFYGFEKLLDQTPLTDQPWMLLSLGVLILLMTGVYYQKLR